MTDTPVNKTSLARDGFAEGWLDADRDGLISAFSWLGKPTCSKRNPELVRDIRPQHAPEAHPNTLSSRFGLGRFPFHTDGAHWPRPPRYLVLYCINPGRGKRPTALGSLFDGLHRDELSILRRDLWRVHGIRQPFWARVLDGHGEKEFLRFDRACMNPLNLPAPSADIMDLHLASSRPYIVQWEASKVLVIDNWRTVHARGASTVIDVDRHHLRLLLE